MVVAGRLKYELLPVGCSDNGRVEGEAAQDVAGAPGSSQPSIKQPEAAGTLQMEPTRLIPWTRA